jgi:hypothetical protein
MTDLATMERALNIIAIAVAVQTTLLIGSAVALFLAYRRTSAALAGELAELRATAAAWSGSVNRAVDTFSRGTQVVTSAVDDARHAAQTATAWLTTAASVVTTPRTAAAMGLLRGVQWWRNRRRAHPQPGTHPSTS